MTRRVLVVDDSRGAQAFLQDALPSLGCRIIGQVDTAAEGVRLAKELRPDLVLMAVGLLDTDGVTATEAIMRASPVPIILLTRHHDPETIRRATASGVMAYLLKPLRTEELGPAIELAIGRFREFEALRRENADLRKSLAARRWIEQAKGILMEQQQLTEREAFEALRRQSMNSQTPLAEIAQAVVTAEAVRQGGGQSAAEGARSRRVGLPRL
ncbi:MAG: ANTAR domain-containing response regulator [Candidatus Methylomirabilales bacterium]